MILKTLEQVAEKVAEMYPEAELGFECQHCGEDCGLENEPTVYFDIEDCHMPYCAKCVEKINV